jgi:phage tail-like protein
MDRTLIPRFLPENYRSAAARPGSPMTGLLAAMEALHGPAERILDSLPIYVSPWGAPDEFVLLQASWLGLDRYFDWSGDRPGKGAPRFRTGTARLRLLVAEAAALDRERGTRDTLRRILEIATGAKGVEIDEGAPDGRAQPFHFTVRAPAAARPLADFVARNVEGERPAHASYSIVFQEMEQIPDKE